MNTLGNHLAILLLVGACARALPAQSPGVRPSDAAVAAALDPTRFEAEIRAFEAADRASPPALGGVVFVGSSSIKNWIALAADFPGVPVLNRGFGGSTLADVVYYADRIVIPYRPRLVVLYAGDNDIAEGRMPERVLGDYRAFVARLRSTWPQARVVFVSIKPSPSRRIYIDRVRETNQRIRAEIARDSLQSYVDVFTPMLDAAGQPRPALFLPDSLHMTRAGYRLWRVLLARVVQGQAVGPLLRSWSPDASGPWPSDTLSTRSHTGTGLLIGGLVGGVATAVFLAGFCSDPDTECGADEIGRAVLFIAVPAALAGALIGSLIRTKR